LCPPEDIISQKLHNLNSSYETNETKVMMAHTGNSLIHLLHSAALFLENLSVQMVMKFPDFMKLEGLLPFTEVHR